MTWERARRRERCHNCAGRGIERDGAICPWCIGNGWEWVFTDKPNKVLAAAMDAPPLAVKRGQAKAVTADDDEYDCE